MARWAWALVVVLCGPLVARAEGSLTLDAALEEARRANARLPVAALDVEVSREAMREARADRWLKVALEGGFVLSPGSGHDLALTDGGEERLQIVGRQLLLDGGARRGAVARAEARQRGAAARYRIAERDLELDVRGQYAECLAAQAEVEARRQGLERLQRYASWLRGRHAAGEGLVADVLKTNVRLASDEADLAEVERRLATARMTLNDLLGRDPASPLEVEASPAPEFAPPSSEQVWQGAPEVGEAEAATSAAEGELRIAEAERKPTLSAGADIGLWGSDTTHLVPPDLKAANPDASFADRIKRDAGYSLSLELSWPLWDHGAGRARVAQAALALRQAQGEQVVERRRARLTWEQAHTASAGAYRQIDILSRAIPVARDAFLDAESRYRGGAASALEVLEAHAASVEAAVGLAEAMLRYRIAQALELRWGTP
jgi:outer membrane protein TolC